MALVLTLDGTDRQTSIPFESIETVEAGPGGVSSARFDIWDPTSAITVAKYDELTVNFSGGGAIFFRGYVVGTRVVPRFGGGGRIISVDLVGPEVLLDWLVAGGASGVTYAADTWLSYAMADVVDQKLAQIDSPLPVATPTAGTAVGGATPNGNATFPVGTMARFSAADVGYRLLEPVTIAKAPLRQQLQALIDHAVEYTDLTPSATPASPVYYTVDSALDFRVWAEGFDTPFMPDDYTSLIVDTAPGGGEFAATILEHEVDWRRSIQRVWVDAAASSGYVGASGFPRHESLITSAASNTAAEVAAVGNNFLMSNGDSEGGTLVIAQMDSPTAETIRPGSYITITSAAHGLSSDTFRISEIHRHFNKDVAQSQVWTVKYSTDGRLPGSFARRLRSIASQSYRATPVVAGF